MATEKKPEVKIDWRIITNNPDKPLIIDVVIEGVSLAKVQKEEFNSVIQSNNGDINALLTSLKEFINK
jgi:phospholipid transport system substrate-binding protein